MIEKKDIFRKIRQIFRHGHGIHASKIIYPIRDWTVGLAVMVILLVIGAIVNINIFAHYSEDYLNQNNSDRTELPYKAALVEKAISLYKNKQESYEAFFQKTKKLPLSAEILSSSSTNSTKMEGVTNEVDEVVVVPIAN